jgi:hypothetical protein
MISLVFRKDSQLITLRPNQTTTYTAARDVQLPSGDSNKVLLGADLVGVSGTLGISNGGTGQTTQQAAIDALLPSQTSNSGKYLTTNGTTSSWGTITQSGVQAISSVTGATTITPSSTSTVYLCNSASPFTLGIATAVGIDGYLMRIKNIGAGVVTVDPNASETIDGATTLALSQYSSITIVASGGSWYLI